MKAKNLELKLQMFLNMFRQRKKASNHEDKNEQTQKMKINKKQEPKNFMNKTKPIK